MKKIFYFYTTVLYIIVGGLQSCKLESEVYDAINASMYPISVRDARDMVTANAYGCFNAGGTSGIFDVATGIMLINDIASDYGFVSWGGDLWPTLEWANFNHMEDTRTTFHWTFLNRISRMTLTIDRIQGMDIDEDIKNQFIAELRCGRGFMAFLIYDKYGPIILADLETLKNPLEEKILPRLSELETQNYIETELKEAAKLLPKNYVKGDADYGRFTAGLCHTVLMKLYMHTKQWDKAIAQGRELIKPEYGYSLVVNKGQEGSAYANIFTEANEKNAEIIWAVNCVQGYNVHPWYPHVLPGNLVSSAMGSYDGGWGGYKMLWSFFHTFEPGDERTQVIISEYNNGLTTLNEANKGTGANSLEDGVIPLKYKIEPNVGTNCQTDYIIYRYADVLTLLAEAIVHDGNQITDEAIELLNMVRTRAGLPAYTTSDFTNAADFIDKLLWERAHELWYEGCRRQDLIRNNKYVEIMSKKCIDNGLYDVISEKGTDFHLFPLPQSAIIEGQGLILQNPGY